MVPVRTIEPLDVSNLPPMNVIFGESPIMALAREKLERVAETDVPVLVQGECGTGKEILAELLHAHSHRLKGAWVKVVCAAIPQSLIESELFGYEKGAFTGAYATKRGRAAQAHLGTLFLDEIGSLDLSSQAKLLQLLQDGIFTRVGGQVPRKIDSRLISTASGDLKQQTDNGEFRLDLFYRINAVTIELPPLRQRVVDLPILIDYFLDLYSRTFRRNPVPLSRDITRLMQRYEWPGNIRQLENMIRSFILIGNEDTLIADLIPSAPTSLTAEIDLTKPISLKEITKGATQDLEQQIILKVLQANGWNRRKTANWLDISYRSLLYKLQEAQISRAPARLQTTRTSATNYILS